MTEHLETDHWRSRPGFASQGFSDFESVEVLLGRFLADRTSPDPLPDFPLMRDNEHFEWGKGSPLEKVVDDRASLDALMRNPLMYRNAIAIVEPWHHVGRNPHGEEARASRNVAYIAQKIADCDSYLLPFWKSGPLDIDQLVPLVTAGIAVVIEGGNPSVRDAASFEGGAASLADLQHFSERLLLSRSPTSAVAIFICLGHQLAAQAHIGLLRQAVAAVMATKSLPRDEDGRLLDRLKMACARIEEIGRSIEIHKYGEPVATGWEHPEFAVGPNEWVEAGARQLQAYQASRALQTRLPAEVLIAHEVTADEFEGVIDTSLQYETELTIAMFHSDEVNEEAMLFANWAYRLLHDALAGGRYVAAGSHLAWLLRIPDGLEILCSTAVDGEVVTECSATSIIYRDFESKRVRRSFTCQFHPELLEDLRVVGDREPPTYAELKHDHGARLFARLLYEGMQE